MRQQKNKVVPLPIPVTEEEEPPPTEVTVDAEEGNAQENTSERKTFWKKVKSFLKVFKRQPNNTSGQVELQGEAVNLEAMDDLGIPGPSTRPSTSAAEHHPSSETPVDAGEPKSQEKQQKKKWWRLGSLFKAKKKSELSPPIQEKPHQELCGVFTDEYILSRYKLGEKLGEGSFGVVHQATRLEDGLKVAVKYVKPNPEDTRPGLRAPGYDEDLPVEVALQIRVNTGPKLPGIVELYDWKVYDDHYVMVFEYPTPCVNLHDYVARMGGRISENLARIIMRQLVEILIQCFEREVFHRDVKLSNILFNEETGEIKLIDFGCGDVWNRSPYYSYSGTVVFCPPEYVMLGRYLGKPATVWSLGVLLFRMVCGNYPTTCELNLMNFNLWLNCRLSNDLCKLICNLLQVQPFKRIGLGKVLSQSWFKKKE